MGVTLHQSTAHLAQDAPTRRALKASLSSDITAPRIFHSALTCPSSYGQYLTVSTCSDPLPFSPTTHCVLSSVVGLYFAALPSCFSLPVFPAALFVFHVSPRQQNRSSFGTCCQHHMNDLTRLFLPPSAVV